MKWRGEIPKSVCGRNEDQGKCKQIHLCVKKAVEKNLIKLNSKIKAKMLVISERYGFVEVSLEDCYEDLLCQAQWIVFTFAHGKGKHKTQLKRDIEELDGYIDRKAEYLTHFGIMSDRNSYSKTDLDATFIHMKENYMRNG